LDKARLEALLEEATVDCYNEEEAFWGMFYTLEGSLSFPLQARVLDETVTLVGWPACAREIRSTPSPSPNWRSCALTR